MPSLSVKYCFVSARGRLRICLRISQYNIMNVLHITPVMKDVWAAGKELRLGRGVEQEMGGASR